ncbi:MAG TPA: hypothetical protein VK766_02790, partial [Cytophagaceae bacterium]|nr:hypothetical protein [Cytophagaceae bacterium]
FQINQSQFFFIRYKWSGETINKKLFIEKDSLLLEADEIFKVDGRLILPGEIQGVSLHYKKGTTVTEIGPFTISFPDESVVKEMIMAFKKHTSSKGEDFIEEVVSLMYDMYGKTDKNNVRAWVKANIGVY